jgi:hypothetical protein
VCTVLHSVFYRLKRLLRNMVGPSLLAVDSLSRSPKTGETQHCLVAVSAFRVAFIALLKADWSPNLFGR